MPQTLYTISANVDIIDYEKNSKLNFALFQGTKGLGFNFNILNKGVEMVDEFVPVSVNVFLITYDRLDGYTTSYSLTGTAGISTTPNLNISLTTDEFPEIVAHPNKCSLVFELIDNDNNSIITTPFQYNVVINHAYSL